MRNRSALQSRRLRSRRLVRGIVALVAVLFGAAAAAQSAPLAITVKKLYVGDGQVIEGATLVIDGGKVVAVGKGIAVPETAERIAFPDGVITPGLIDADSDVGFSGVETEHITEVVPQFKMIDAVNLGAREMKTLAREGVTTIGLASDPGAVIGSAGAVVKTGTAESGRVLMADGAVRVHLTHDPQFRGGSNRPPSGAAPTIFNRRPTTEMGTVFVVREAFYKAADLRDLLAQKAAPKDLDQASRVLTEVLEGKRRLRVMANQYHEISAAFRIFKKHGDPAVDDFDLPFSLDRGAEVWRAIDEVARTKTPVVYGPVFVPQAEPIRVPRFMRASGDEGDRRLSTAAVLEKRGVPFALTSAGGRGENGLARQAMHAVRAGLPRSAAVVAVTSAPARILGVEARVGALKTGLDADFVVWTGEPFEALSRQDAVYIQGVRVEGKAW